MSSSTVHRSAALRGLLVGVVVVALAATACSSAADTAQQDRPVSAATERATFAVQAGIGFIAVRDASPGAVLVVADPSGRDVAQGSADRFGSKLFRDLPAGAGYTVRSPTRNGVAGSAGVKVLRFGDDPPDSFYAGQKPLVDGYQYLTTRDGTTLAITVRLPGGKTVEDGPFPTLVNMSGYADADPGSAPPMAQIAAPLGFATVSVNERGSGCSGGVAGLFDRIWAADGYDVVEAIAAQKWSGKVGLTGISFPGITQLFTAGAQPPHLAAISPMSVIADVYRSPGFPGGIFNNGFTKSWLTDRRNDAKPAPEGGQGYAVQRVKDGDAECLSNQDLRLQTLDPIAITSSSPYRVPSLTDERSAMNWVDKIEVPILLMGAWQDEQVGSDFAHLFPLLPRRPDVKVVVSNGVHASPIEPTQLSQWLAFVDIYVADKVPDQSLLEAIYGVVAPQVQGGDEAVPSFPANPYAADKTLAEAKARYEAQPRVRVLFDNGGSAASPGLPGPGFEQGFDTWPPKETVATRWYFGAGGALAPTEPSGDKGADRYFPTIDARPMQTIPGFDQGLSWELLPGYDWRPLPSRTAVGYITRPLPTDTTMMGTGSADLWLRSSLPDTDLQVTLTEVRPDGTEIYVQNGLLRASHRKLDPKRTTEISPWPTHLESDAEPLPAGKFSLVRVEIMPVAHLFRKGSRLRITVEAPGGDRTQWAFESAPPPADARVDISRSETHPSSIVLPLVTTIRATDPTPVCPGLRGQPCRTYQPAANGG